MTSFLGYLLIAMSLGSQFEASKYRSETRPTFALPLRSVMVLRTGDDIMICQVALDHGIH
jgi:hypothetical protein